MEEGGESTLNILERWKVPGPKLVDRTQNAFWDLLLLAKGATDAWSSLRKLVAAHIRTLPLAATHLARE